MIAMTPPMGWDSISLKFIHERWRITAIFSSFHGKTIPALGMGRQGIGYVFTPRDLRIQRRKKPRIHI